MVQSFPSVPMTPPHPRQHLSGICYLFWKTELQMPYCGALKMCADAPPRATPKLHFAVNKPQRNVYWSLDFYRSLFLRFSFFR